MNTEVLNSLMDVAGAPSHPLIFLVLGGDLCASYGGREFDVRYLRDRALGLS